MGTCPGSFRLLLTGGMTLGGAIRELSTGVIHLFIPKPWTMENMRQALELAALHSESHRGRH